MFPERRSLLFPVLSKKCSQTADVAEMDSGLRRLRNRTVVGTWCSASAVIGSDHVDQLSDSRATLRTVRGAVEPARDRRDRAELCERIATVDQNRRRTMHSDRDCAIGVNDERRLNLGVDHARRFDGVVYSFERQRTIRTAGNAQHVDPHESLSLVLERPMRMLFPLGSVNRNSRMPHGISCSAVTSRPDDTNRACQPSTSSRMM